MAVVFFIQSFVTGNTQFVGINHDNVITGVYVRGEFGLMFAAQTAGDFGCHTAKYFVLGVDDKPIALNLMRFR